MANPKINTVDQKVVRYRQMYERKLLTIEQIEMLVTKKIITKSQRDEILYDVN